LPQAIQLMQPLLNAQKKKTWKKLQCSLLHKWFLVIWKIQMTGNIENTSKKREQSRKVT